MPEQFEYNKLSPEELARNISVKISPGRSRELIENAIKLGSGINFILDEFNVYLSNGTHRTLGKENGHVDGSGYICGSIFFAYNVSGPMRVTLKWNNELMAKIFNVPAEKAYVYVAAINEQVLLKTASLVEIK
jgi:hypothetical protein